MGFETDPPLGNMRQHDLAGPVCPFEPSHPHVGRCFKNPTNQRHTPAPDVFDALFRQ
jgi:hypothetical protein